MESSISRIKLFIGSQKPQQLISDIAFWTALYQRMAGVEGQCVHGISETIEFIDERLKPHIDVMYGDAKIHVSKEKCRFLYDVLAIRNTLDTKLATAAVNYENFVKDAGTLKKFKDEDKNMSIDLKYRKKAFKDMHTTYSKYKSVTEERKFRYQSVALEAEKLEIDILNESREKYLREMTKGTKRLQRKAERDELRYKVAVDKAQEKFEILKATAAQYETCFTKQETARANVILETLSDGGQKFGVYSNTQDGCRLFDHEDVHALTKEASLTGTYKVHEFEVFSKSLLQQLQKRSKVCEKEDSDGKKKRKRAKSDAKTKVSEHADKFNDGESRRVSRRKRFDNGSDTGRRSKTAIDDRSKAGSNKSTHDGSAADDGNRKAVCN